MTVEVTDIVTAIPVRTVVAMIAVPLLVALMIAVAVLGRRIAPEARLRMERILAAVVYVSATSYFGWGLADSVGEQDWTGSSLRALLTFVFAGLALRSIWRLSIKGQDA